MNRKAVINTVVLVLVVVTFAFSQQANRFFGRFGEVPFTPVGSGSGGSMFVGSTATSSSGIGGTTAAPTLNTADISSKSPHVFQMPQLTVNVTSVTVTTSAGADFWIKWKQAAAGGPYSVGGYVNLGADSTVCDTATLAAGKTLFQHFIVEADGTTLDGAGCTSNDPADLPPASAKVTGTNSSRQFVAAVAADLASLFSGCSGTKFLAADGACYYPAAATVVNSGTITLPAGNSILVICTSTCSIPVPVPALNYQLCAKNIAGGTTVITLSALGSSAMYPKSDDSGYGTAGTGTMVSTAAAGNKVCLIGKDSTHYELGAVNDSTKWTAN